MNNGEPTTEFTDEEQRIIKGTKGFPREKLDEAYESFAEEVRNKLIELHGDLADDYFDERPFIETVVFVKPRAHNNWVKEYWVKAY
jgi:hypothetical protein